MKFYFKFGFLMPVQILVNLRILFISFMLNCIKKSVSKNCSKCNFHSLCDAMSHIYIVSNIISCGVQGSREALAFDWTGLEMGYNPGSNFPPWL